MVVRYCDDITIQALDVSQLQFGETPVNSAKTKGYYEIVSLLEKALTSK